MIQVTKVGRDAVLYVESLIESIMGGLEGLINILCSEGGFGSLEMQVGTKYQLFYFCTQDFSCTMIWDMHISASSGASSCLPEFIIKAFYSRNQIP